MDRRDFIKSSAMLSASAAVLGACANARPLLGQPAVPAIPHIWDRPLHFVLNPLRKLHTDADLLKAIDQASPAITAITPFSLNTADFTPLAPFIAELKKRNIVITPGVGAKPKDGSLNSDRYKAMVRAARPYTDHIRLENMQGFLDHWGVAPIQEMIDYCVAQGFKHIMLNPWPKENGKIVPFKNPEIGSSFNQVRISFDRQTLELHENPNNYLTDINYVKDILAYRPDCAILVNYESAPQHELLAHMEQVKPGSSLGPLEITAKQCHDFKGNLFFAPPFTHVYDPIALGTWDAIARMIGQMP